MKFLNIICINTKRPFWPYPRVKTTIPANMRIAILVEGFLVYIFLYSFFKNHYWLQMDESKKEDFFKKWSNFDNGCPAPPPRPPGKWVMKCTVYALPLPERCIIWKLKIIGRLVFKKLKMCNCIYTTHDTQRRTTTGENQLQWVTWVTLVT